MLLEYLSADDGTYQSQKRRRLYGTMLFYVHALKELSSILFFVNYFCVVFNEHHVFEGNKAQKWLSVGFRSAKNVNHPSLPQNVYNPFMGPCG